MTSAGQGATPRYWALLAEMHEHTPFCGTRCTELVAASAYEALLREVEGLKAALETIETMGGRGFAAVSCANHAAEALRKHRAALSPASGGV